MRLKPFVTNRRSVVARSVGSEYPAARTPQPCGLEPDQIARKVQAMNSQACNARATTASFARRDLNPSAAMATPRTATVIPPAGKKCHAKLAQGNKKIADTSAAEAVVPPAPASHTAAPPTAAPSDSAFSGPKSVAGAAASGLASPAFRPPAEAAGSTPNGEPLR